ncbi:hypothetical protein Cni_G04687 [Canna indica]|uniref:Phenazine biosynthesis PhzC/PhzF protein n=1 Tax=Canna indica TaxID=4628 RepID=A0AAQ3Q473_9LILI|nr:hypothetical protein Cni_G04687 [Canna indica]
MATSRTVKYAVIDAFASSPFTGNPAAVCLLESPEIKTASDQWMQYVAREFNISETAFLSRANSGADSGSAGLGDGDSNAKFCLRWFTPVAEVTSSPFFFLTPFCNC